MKHLLAVLILILLVPGWAGAVSNEEWLYAREIGQRWVEEHNAKLPDLVKKASRLVSKEGNQLVVPSKGLKELAKKSLDVDNASNYGIPSQVVNAKGVTVGLMKLYRTDVTFVPGGELELYTADYYDELAPIHAVSDLYIHIGLKYMPFFHSEGYAHGIRVFWMDGTEKETPVFFEVGQYGGGVRVDKTLYTLDKNKVAGLPQMLFDSPEKIDPQDMIQKKLSWSVWLAGETSYRDLAGDDTLEIVNVTRAVYPDDLKVKLAKKYWFVNTDYTHSFRKTVSVYRWNDKKQALDDLGDFYY